MTATDGQLDEDSDGKKLLKSLKTLKSLSTDFYCDVKFIMNHFFLPYFLRHALVE